MQSPVPSTTISLEDLSSATWQDLCLPDAKARFGNYAACTLAYNPACKVGSDSCSAEMSKSGICYWHNLRAGSITKYKCKCSNEFHLVFGDEFGQHLAVRLGQFPASSIGRIMYAIGGNVYCCKYASHDERPADICGFAYVCDRCLPYHKPMKSIADHSTTNHTIDCPPAPQSATAELPSEWGAFCQVDSVDRYGNHCMGTLPNNPECIFKNEYCSGTMANANLCFWHSVRMGSVTPYTCACGTSRQVLFGDATGRSLAYKWYKLEEQNNILYGDYSGTYCCWRARSSGITTGKCGQIKVCDGCISDHETFCYDDASDDTDDANDSDNDSNNNED